MGNGTEGGGQDKLHGPNQSLVGRGGKSILMFESPVTGQISLLATIGPDTSWLFAPARQ
jgi:hypothetical protein